MLDFTHIKYGVLISIIAILFGGLMGLSFGCCEDSIKGSFKSSAAEVLNEKYGGAQEKADAVAKKAWVYMKRAHLHSQTMGVIAIAFALLIAWLKFPARFQMVVSILGGLGSLGYGFFWLLAGAIAPGMGSTGAAKEAVGLIAQVSGAAFFLSALAVFGMLVYRMFVSRPQEDPSGGSA